MLTTARSCYLGVALAMCQTYPSKSTENKRPEKNKEEPPDESSQLLNMLLSVILDIAASSKGNIPKLHCSSLGAASSDVPHRTPIITKGDCQQK